MMLRETFAVDLRITVLTSRAADWNVPTTHTLLCKMEAGAHVTMDLDHHQIDTSKWMLRNVIPTASALVVNGPMLSIRILFILLMIWKTMTNV
jgi:hypothetical protein